MPRKLLLASIVLLFSVARSFAFDVTACGQAVPDRETGVLQVDLDCSADAADAAVTVGRTSTLDMNGHSIVARHIAVSCGTDIHVPGCTIVGPGDISGGNYGITGHGRRVTVSDVDVHDVAIQGITAGRRLGLTNVTVERAINGIIGYGPITATNVVVNDNEYAGIDGRSIKGSTITANDNGFAGVSCRKCVITGLTATGNGVTDVPVGAGGGIQGGAVKLTNSTVTANVLDGAPVDIDTFALPRLTNTVCDRSKKRLEPGSTWGVCAAD